MISQNNIRIFSYKPFILGFLFFCFYSGEAFSQDNSGNVYDYVQPKSQPETTVLIRGENSVDKKNHIIGYSNDQVQKPSTDKKELPNESKIIMPQHTSETGQTSTLSLNIFLYVLDSFKEE